MKNGRPHFRDIADAERPAGMRNRNRLRRPGHRASPPATILAVDLHGTAVVFEEFGSVIAPGGAEIAIASQSGHRSTWTFGVLIRVGWLTIAVAGLAALVTDIRQLT